MASTSDHSEASDSLQHAEQLTTEALIRLQVGERHFTTTKDTLAEGSAFFAALLSSRWDNALDDGSYFIDADPALFEHILRYLRRGLSFPCSSTSSRGTTTTFMSPSWKRPAHTADQYDDDYSSWAYLKAPSGVTVEYHSQWAIRKVYICPRVYTWAQRQPNVLWAPLCRCWGWK
ncbi:hypothetical protein B0T22DRAFT_485630 [Podospora appendiculata]|uniref:BTB domain-containing protein n=1 Tax=Podospora appendiculata TaxID=314037 RepID=A0AAE1C772_9PEZI|nr:hypothetical protein B0T22DRAFT_485630 [Podospora appendiculata]